MITITPEEYQALNPDGTATAAELAVAAVIYSYTGYKEVDEDDVETVKQAIQMLADYELDNGIISGVAKNEMKSVSVDGFGYSTTGSKVTDIKTATMPAHITALLAPTNLLYRGL